MFQPAPASSRAIARPSRLAAPVTSAVFPLMRSMIADIAAYLAPEHPIRPPRIDGDNGQQKQGADTQEDLGAWVRGGLLQREMVRHDHGEQADGDPHIGQREK